MSMDGARFRQLFGHFATGVTVVTTAVDGWLHGMTANAVTSVSLDPLLLLVCVDKSAHAHEQLAKAGKFGVNILSEEQEELSRLFAEHAPPEHGRLQGAGYFLGPNGTPVLEDCLVYLECAVAQQCPGGDHTVFLGEVLHGEVLRDARPLLFYRGGYRNLA
jgi:flavin reductase (DIM6/NTAB) family NADH-FMN oxidoreductase RutF